MPLIYDGIIICIKAQPSEVIDIIKELGTLFKYSDSIAAGYSHENHGEELPWHIDGIYMKDIPEFVCLGCVENLSKGGITQFVQSKKIVNKLLLNNPNLSSINIQYERNRDNNNESSNTVFPLISKYMADDTLIYRANIPTFKGLEQSIKFDNTVFMDEDEIYNAINGTINDMVIDYSHIWESGDILLFNNRLFIHKRTSYEGKRIILRNRFSELTL
jgi:alpha-ketoglutarate-dependent taurine dioxygenase